MPGQLLIVRNTSSGVVKMRKRRPQRRKPKRVNLKPRSRETLMYKKLVRCTRHYQHIFLCPRWTSRHLLKHCMGCGWPECVGREGMNLAIASGSLTALTMHVPCKERHRSSRIVDSHHNCARLTYKRS
jgi:hypothetical protein